MVVIASPPPLKPPSPLFRIVAAGSFMLRIFDPTRHGTTALTRRFRARAFGGKLPPKSSLGKLPPKSSLSFRYFGPLGRFDHQRLALGFRSASRPEGFPADRSETATHRPGGSLPVVCVKTRQRLSPTGSSSEDPDRGISYAGLTLSCCLVECFGDVGVIEIKGQQIARLELTRDLTLLDLRGSGAMRAGAVAALAKIADRHLSQAWSRYFYEQTADYGQLDGISYLNAHNDEEAIAIYERAQSAQVCPDSQILPLNHPSLRPAILEAALTKHLDFLA
jgi:RES domain